ncbi:nuclear transport factor 2 family protein [uncultured Thiocystis sp.]|jgi:hypothetical protein|uniref:nuclear transport factor 2 family protein n=1 Tax=uncultured Thiocystis sp. TaxID=1202134 RepID=UPI0025CB99DA|nr:nuclear transport factor 2 family protein [uncultured Thiocystis sp.]
MRFTTLLLLVAATLFQSLPLSAEPPPPLNEDMVRNTLLSWFRQTNDHRPLEELLPYLDDQIEMFYPDRPEPFQGKDAFADWYRKALLRYFDETHHLEALAIRIDGDTAAADLIVRWERREWEPGAARSRYTASLSYQDVVFRRDPATGRLTITKKIVKKFEPTAPIFGGAE